MKILIIFVVTITITKENKTIDKENDFSLYLKTMPYIIRQEARMTVPELIRSKGYPVESHKVVTEDGYILTLHRIPYGKFRKKEKARGVIYLQHGLMGSSAEWVLCGPENALAYLLADNDFDIWMGNARGNRYSRNHTKLTPLQNKFWNFSFHEIGAYDMPAMIDYILNKTNSKNLFHAGYSLGTTTFFVMCSERPEYNKKIKAHFSLAPVVYMEHIHSPLLKILAKFEDRISLLTKLIGKYEFLPHSNLTAVIGKVFCDDKSITQIFCSNVLSAIFGIESEVNNTILPVLLGHFPSGSSSKQILHYSQEVNSGNFRQYDFGFEENIKKYGTSNPPDYKIDNIIAPIYLFYSKSDWLTDIKDMTRLNNQLENSRAMIEIKNFNHLDFMYGIRARDLIFENILQIMLNY